MSLFRKKVGIVKNETDASVKKITETGGKPALTLSIRNVIGYILRFAPTRSMMIACRQRLILQIGNPTQPRFGSYCRKN